MKLLGIKHVAAVVAIGLGAVGCSGEGIDTFEEEFSLEEADGFAEKALGGDSIFPQNGSDFFVARTRGDGTGWTNLNTYWGVGNSPANNVVLVSEDDAPVWERSGNRLFIRGSNSYRLRAAPSRGTTRALVDRNSSFSNFTYQSFATGGFSPATDGPLIRTVLGQVNGVSSVLDAVGFNSAVGTTIRPWTVTGNFNQAFAFLETDEDNTDRLDNSELSRFGITEARESGR